MKSTKHPEGLYQFYNALYFREEIIPADSLVFICNIVQTPGRRTVKGYPYYRATMISPSGVVHHHPTFFFDDKYCVKVL